MSTATNTQTDFKNRFLKMSDDELIDVFNNDVGKHVWISARARFHSALCEEFDKRGFDYSSIGHKEQGTLNINRKIKLVGHKIEIL
jgi:hypothetical protein